MAAARSLAPTEFPLFIFPSSVQTVSMRAELTELFIASPHTRLHLASSSSSSSHPRGGGTRDKAGHGAGQDPRARRGGQGKSWEAMRGRERSRRRCAKQGDVACKVERSRGWTRGAVSGAWRGTEAGIIKNCFGREWRREMGGSYSLVRMGALDETVLGQPSPGIAWEMVRVRPASWKVDLGGCRNILSHPVQRESLKKSSTGVCPMGRG